MLQLQRASAGSGKTFTLAKKFIEYYISEPTDDRPCLPEEKKPRRLRPTRALRESLQHILAITFTNKATNEMKLRIVEKLNALAEWTPDTDPKKVDYLEDFVNDFRCSPQEIAAQCRLALKILLTDYGDFKVSTIDSFFQTVLRTFAYEADLDDTYQLEIDSHYITQMGLDTTIDDLNSDGKSPQGAAWIRNMMAAKASSGNAWNIFQKKDDGRGNSVYSEILHNSKKLENEDFKMIRESLDAFFRDNPDFFGIYTRLCQIYETPRKEAFNRMRKAARAVDAAFRKLDLDMGENGGRYLKERVQKMGFKWKWNQALDKVTFPVPVFTRKNYSTRVLDPRKKISYLDTPEEDDLQRLAESMYAAFDEWRTESLSDRSRCWQLYRATLPYLALLQGVRENSRLFLTDSNTVELGETNAILRRIIGEDDAPFIYERLGSRLEHFLIDEFQDTSRLQWENMLPLLSESNGKGNDNLIIGDAKQSIYRFRNAEPKLITEEVEKKFPNCYPCGDKPSENTNWRSSLRIVEFNNLFFKFFSKALGERMEKLYANTVQIPAKKKDIGYVQVTLTDGASDEDEIPLHFKKIPLMIADMLDRGYRMSDIAILVDKSKDGVMIIESIMRYNLKDDTERKINVISVDSLKVGESPAVQTVVAILESINSGTEPRLNPKEERRTKGAGEWSRIKADFSFFAMHNPDRPLSELMASFLEGDYDPDAIPEMLAGMSTTVLPALVENIIRQFIPPHVRQSEVPFLTALQDMVIEYCEGHTADIGSFLDWWYKKGRSRSIASPEGVDAVNVMTVHKSKGLEFRCVIIPNSEQTTKPTKDIEKEWLWVKPELPEAATEGLPVIPYVPVITGSNLEGTPHEADYKDYLEKYMTDKVNMAYVAYTRAVDELYIFTPTPFKNKNPQTHLIGYYLWQCGEETEGISVDRDTMTWSFGTPLNREEVLAGRKKEEKTATDITVREYRCGTLIPALIYSDPASPDTDTLPSDLKEETPVEQESEETRRFGELMHSVMENVVTAADLPRALLKAKSAGFITSREMEDLKASLGKAMADVEAYGWFDPACRVINERGIMVGGKVRRPDRIVIRPDGTALIVDYKFGLHRNDDAYCRQAKGYASALLKTGLAKKCEAYIWYVSLGDVVRIA